MKRKKFIEPELIKAGDTRVKLGYNSEPPKVDIRVLSEETYQLLITAYNDMNKISEKVNELNEVLNNGYEYPNIEWVKTTVEELNKVIKENTITTNVFDNFSHEIIEKIRNSQSDAEARKHIAQNLKRDSQGFLADENRDNRI